jgi:alpha-L-arabinofuranosidase
LTIRVLRVLGETFPRNVGNLPIQAVSASASQDKAGKTHISLVNIHMGKPQTINIALNGIKATQITGRILTSVKVQDHNTFEHLDTIKPASFTGFKVSGNQLSVTLPPVSVVVLEIQ